MAAKESPPTATEQLAEVLGKGRAFSVDAGEPLSRLLGVPVTREGISRVFQPGFPGVRVFVVEARAAHDHAVELTLVGASREGVPVWIGTRALVRGRDGGLEIHHGHDEIDAEYRGYHMNVDSVRRELSLLRAFGGGPSARLTADAVGPLRFLCAVHGFIFADETEEGPPIRSIRALEPDGDRTALLAAAPAFVDRIARRFGAGAAEAEEALEAIRSARAPCAIAQVELQGVDLPIAEGEEGFAGGLGKAFLLAEDTPAWRAALYITPVDPEASRVGEAYRRTLTSRAEARIAGEVQEARDLLSNPQRAVRMRALRTLGRLAAAWVAPDVKALEESEDRGLAAIARQTIRQISGADLPERLLAYAQNRKNDGRLRGYAFRVMAEYFPQKIESLVSILRVDPDARVQRSVIPYIAEQTGDDAGPALGTLLAANPWSEGPTARPGLLELRMEIIERLARSADPRTLPALMAALAARVLPPPAELLALSKALVAYPDPRARMALTQAAQQLDRPPVP